MSRKAVVFEAPRTGYGIDQVSRPVTVGELREFLEEFEDDTLFVLSHDNGYTFGSIDAYTQQTYIEQEDGEWEPRDW